MKLMVFALAFLPAICSAHGGGLDASGCHHNCKTGDYHRYRAPAAVPKIELPSNLERPLPDPTRHVGPL